jgi:hypothetical protein
MAQLGPQKNLQQQTTSSSAMVLEAFQKAFLVNNNKGDNNLLTIAGVPHRIRLMITDHTELQINFPITITSRDYLERGAATAMRISRNVEIELQGSYDVAMEALLRIPHMDLYDLSVGVVSVWYAGKPCIRIINYGQERVERGVTLGSPKSPSSDSGVKLRYCVAVLIDPTDPIGPPELAKVTQPVASSNAVSSSENISCSEDNDEDDESLAFSNCWRMFGAATMVLLAAAVSSPFALASMER